MRCAISALVLCRHDKRNDKELHGHREIMSKPIRILLQTTIPPIDDDWNINRFSLLSEHLASLKDNDGQALCEVTARDRERETGGDDVMLSKLDATDFDELWLLSVYKGGGLDGV